MISYIYLLSTHQLTATVGLAIATESVHVFPAACMYTSMYNYSCYMQLLFVMVS